MILQCLYMIFGLESGHQLSTYASGEGMEDHPKYVQLRTGGVVLRLMYTRALALSLFML